MKLDINDPHDWMKIKRDQSEYKIYEGLIYTLPLYQAIESLKEHGYDTKANYTHTTFIINKLFSNDYNIALTQLNNLIRITNNYGYDCSYMAGQNKSKSQEYEYDLKNFKKLIDDNLISIRLFFEAKFDIYVDKNPSFLYHLTPTRNLPKILKIGLCPKSKTKKSNHSPRVYLAKTYKDFDKLVLEFKNETGILKWSILEIETETIDHFLKLFKDPNFYEKGYFTYNNIWPQCIKVIGKYDL
jgi:hypothetical protein